MYIKEQFPERKLKIKMFFIFFKFFKKFGKTVFVTNRKNYFFCISSFLAFKKSKNTFSPVAGFKMCLQIKFWMILG